jgi:hypothetical protein
MGRHHTLAQVSRGFPLAVLLLGVSLLLPRLVFGDTIPFLTECLLASMFIGKRAPLSSVAEDESD